MIADCRAEISHAAEAELWSAVADSIEPRARMRPSEWAEANVRLTAEQSPHRPGPFRCDWKPWVAAVHDLLYEHPGKRGVIAMKPAQIGFTRAVLNLAGQAAGERPGPMLFLISTARQASHFAVEHFLPMVRASDELAALFKVRPSDKRREISTEIPFRGGRIDFAGAGTVSNVTSRTYLWVGIDEYEVFMDEFPSSAAGDGFTMAEARTQAAEHLASVWVWSHPRSEGKGIHRLYVTQSDRRRWVFDCPHCAGVVDPTWACVHMETDGDGEVDADTAVFRCPCCGEIITDAERARAVWPAERGGSGRFASELEDDEADARDYVGIAINRLADPDVTVRGLARRSANAKSDSERMAFYNTVLGEPYRLTSAIITEDLVTARVQRAERLSVPGGTWGCKLLTVGADVQAPEANPTLYVRASAWAGNGMEFIVDLVKLSGWAAMTEYLRTLRVPIGEGETWLAPRLFSVDCGAFTGQVLDYCRTPIYHRDSGRRISLLPLRYQSYVKAATPAIVPTELKRTDPSRPHLGPLDLYDLHRHTWVDRTLRRVAEDRVTVLCDVPGDFAAHLCANVMEPVKDVHGWGNPAHEWSRIKDRRDDWAQAGAFNEAGATLELRLHQLYEEAAMVEEGEREGRPARPARKPRSGVGFGSERRARGGGGSHWKGA